MDHKLTTSVDRRGFLAAVTGGTGLLLADCGRRPEAPASTNSTGLSGTGKADITLRIAPVLADIVPAREHLRYSLTPQPSGARFVHSHVMAMSDLSRGTYTGQFAMVYVEPKANPGQYDQEVFLATHDWEPFYRCLAYRAAEYGNCLMNSLKVTSPRAD
jgi:hypothetical protein